MSRLRPPVVAGVGGGVGTTTLAVALRGHDAGCRAVGSADILACRGTLDSLRRAATVLDHAAPGAPPVLAVTLDEARARGPLRVRLELLGPQAAAVVLLPHVGRWRLLADPFAEVASLLVQPPARLPRPLRSYVAALRELAAAVAESGRLDLPAARVPGPEGPYAPYRRPDGPARSVARRPDGPARSVASHSAGRPDGSRTSARELPEPGRAGRPGTVPPGRAQPRIVGAFRPVAAPVPPPSRGVRIVPPPSAPVRVRTAAPLPQRDSGREPRSHPGVPGRPAEQAEQVG